MICLILFTKCNIASGHLEVLKWARANGCDWDASTCISAAGHGHLDVLKWAHAHGCPYNSLVIAHAAHGNHSEVLTWARANITNV